MRERSVDIEEEEPTLVRGSTPRPAGGMRQILGEGSEGSLLWLNETACEGMDIDDFFVEAGRAISPEAMAVCRGCKVRLECVRHAYEMQVNGGYFGGLSPGQRRDYNLDEALRLIKREAASTARGPEAR